MPTEYTQSITLTEPNGRIWPCGPPTVTTSGLLCVFCSPSSKVNAEIRSGQFTAVAFDTAGAYLCLVDSVGKVGCLLLHGGVWHGMALLWHTMHQAPSPA